MTMTTRHGVDRLPLRLPLILVAAMAGAASVAACRSSVALEPDPVTPGSGGGGAVPMGGTGVMPGQGGMGGTLAADDTPGPMPLRRLTRSEYLNSLLDLLGAQSLTLPPDGRDEYNGPWGFLAASSVATGDDARYLMQVADEAARSASQRLAQLLPPTCAPALASRADEDACAAQFITRFGARAFRRPLRDAEAADLLLLYQSSRGPEVAASFPDAIRIVISGILQSPFFLYHWEIVHPLQKEGPLVRLGPHAVAARLSYALVGTMPDETLRAAADAGELDTADRIATQARRLLADPRAREAMASFVDQWLDLGRLPELEKDPIFNFSAAVSQSMRRETGDFFTGLLLGPAADGKLETLFTSVSTSIDAPLATIYGVAGVVGPGWRPVTLDPAQRSGLLTQASFLASTADSVTPNPVDRGVTLLRQIICQTIEEEGPGVDVPALPTPLANATNRERLEQHSMNACAVRCHSIIDPAGFLFENYDAVGAWRALDAGRPVNATGKLVMPSGTVSFNNAVELSHRLPMLEETRDCMGKQWLRYFLRRLEGPGDRASLQAAGGAFRDAGYDIRKLVLALTGTRSFTHRTPSVGEVTP